MAIGQNAPLMPKATAVWLVDNTSLSFEQIAAFCKLHPLEVKAIADGDAAQGIKGLDPIQTGQLTREEIDRAEKDPAHKLDLAISKVRVPETKKRAPRYTPVSKRQDRPNAILWLLRNHPEVKDSQIIRLVGTTKSTIQAIRDRSHWNSPNLQPADPVTLGLCTQIELDLEVDKASVGLAPPAEEQSEPATLLSVDDALSSSSYEAERNERNENTKVDPESLFAGLRAWKKGERHDEDEDDVVAAPVPAAAESVADVAEAEDTPIVDDISEDVSEEVADDEEVAAVASEETGDETAGDEADAADDTGEDDADKR
tara:strand:- start:179 stop:1120 length:942 start_codon:yes stop_codon:yes gene_type:complete